MAAVFACVVNLQAWRKRTRRRGLYFFAAVVTGCLALIYGASVFGLADIGLFIDSLVLRGLVILLMLGTGYHALIDA